MKKKLFKYIKDFGLLIIPLIFVFLPFSTWLVNEYYDYNKENLVLWTSFIPILSYIIGLLIGILHIKFKKTKYEYSDTYH